RSWPPTAAASFGGEGGLGPAPRGKAPAPFQSEEETEALVSVDLNFPAHPGCRHLAWRGSAGRTDCRSGAGRVAGRARLFSEPGRGPRWVLAPRVEHRFPQARPRNDVSPYFKTEPARSQVHLEGNRLVLTCMAEGSWPLEFKWLHNGRELTKFSLEYRYMITSLDRTHAGFYRCIVRNRMGALLQRQTEVQVAYMGSFEDGEARQSVSHGEAAVIRAPHIASFPQPQVTWFRDGRKIPPSSRIAITLDNTLVILSTVAPDAGRYYVQAVNDKNGDNKTSQPIALTVENVGGPADPIAPTIIIPPRNTSVVAGTSEVTMECVANARWVPAARGLARATLGKGEKPPPGLISDYNRRLTILNPALSDSGYYECEAVLPLSPRSAAGISGPTSGLPLAEPPQFVKEPEKHVTAEMETVVVIPCQARGVPPPAMAWYKDAAPIHLEKLSRFRLQPDGSLQISGLVPDDTGMFQCFAHNDAGEVQTSTYLAVTSIAPNITRGPQDSTVIDGMSAILTCETSGAPRPAITWQKGERILASGSVQLPRFTLLESGSLLISPTHIADVGSYTCLATNSRGVDEASADLVVWARTRITAPPQDQSVIKGTKASLSCGVTHDPSVTIRHIWEKDGAPISVDSVPRVRLDGDGTLHISQTWSGDIGTYTCKVVSVGGNDSRSAHLRVRAGLGVYSMKVTEWTLQGVPTVPPGNVQAEATNSTTVRFTWNPPSPQFINGINQGYKVRAAWPHEATVVTVRPNFQDSIHVGYVVGLKKFAEYFTSVLCFTTPGDGPRSPPQLVRTHEDVPGPVGHLSFSDILDTSLKVSWQEPVEKNGILTGYRISWEEYNRTNTRVTHYLPNVTLEYRVTGLTALTTYTIEVAAMTSKGQGQVSSSTISSGVPPELPGAPTNLGISNISPRSVTLQFRPGYDGKTSISRWQVEAQVGQVGESEEWVLVHQLANEPDSRSMEVPGLNPYTYYSFRMRQVNIVGTSPPSLPSRRIQTLQAPPDVAPANVTLRTASETSLWLRWMPLPEQEYNGSPESVGYRVRYARSDGRGRTALHAIHDRVEREFTIEDLEEWTEYQVQVQAFNAIGAGPWSRVVAGRTRESVPSSGPANVSALATTSTPVPGGNASRSAQLAGLGKYVLYEIRVLAFTRIGDGVPSHPPILERTLDDVPGPPVGILFPEVRTTSVRLIWQPPAAPNGIILAYQITHRLNTTNANTATVEVLNPSARQYTALGLRPESTYLFRITAQTRKGWGEAAEALVVTTEKRDRPQPPSKPAVPQEEVKARSVLLSWEPGSDGLSPVRYYTVQTRELPAGEWSLHSASVSHNTTSFVVDRLKPFTSYKFRVKATNDIGDSAYSEASESLTTLQAGQCPQGCGLHPGLRVAQRRSHLGLHARRTMGTPGDGAGPPGWGRDTPGACRSHHGAALSLCLVPTAAPQNVAVQAATATQLDVTWEPPPPEAQNGDIQGYKIYFWEAQRANETERVKTLFLPESGVKLKNLTGYTAYLVSVAAFNAAGDGPRSPPAKARTQQAAPSAPSAIRFSELTTTSVNVSWEPPLLPNGILEGYRLVYEPCMPVDGVSKIVTVDVKGSSPLWMKVKDLAEGVTYRFRIRAKTFAYGPEIEGICVSITIHWSSGDPGKGPITRYVIEARPSDEGLWDILIKDIPKEVTSYTFSLDILKQGVSYDFRVIAVNDYGYGTPSAPSPAVSAQKANPFYEEWWFLVVIALVGLIFILLLVFVLIIRGQSKKYAKNHGEMVSLDEGSFPALELNSRRLSVKNSFCRKNGIYTRSPPRPSPGSLHYSDEDVTKYNDLIPAESSSLTEKPSEISDSQGSDSEYEVDPNPQKAHSFVNHYISDPTYYNSWRRQQKGISRAQAYSYTESDSGDPDHCPLSNSNSTQQGSLFRLAPGSRAPIAGFSSFV
uniref:Sidekick cell adhesion molecule 2 n=1 Tax=Crocodylus porosus TaxID=8502 RepID=A0A7M4FNJ1_CROPO